MPRVDKLWFNDGSVVLQAGDKLFFLHKSFLSARSEVFKQILEDKNYDSIYGVSRDVDISGRVLISLPDSPQDVHYFFLAIYGVVEQGFFEPPPAHVAMDVVLGILRMSTAYRVPALRRRALAHLNTSYPLTLTEWDLRTERATVTAHRQSCVAAVMGGSEGIAPRESTFATAFAVLRTAQQERAPWLLPIAFYNCCSSHLDVIMDHFSRLEEAADGGVDAGAGADNVQDLQNAVIRGAFAHLEATRELLAFLFLPPADGCVDPSACLEIRRICMANVYSSYPGNDPLAIWEDKDDWEVYLDGMCAACTSMCSAAHYHERQSFWNGLPETYGMRYNWALLEEMYREEM